MGDDTPCLEVPGTATFDADQAITHDHPPANTAVGQLILKDLGA